MFKIAPSLMCADLLSLGHQVRELERAGVDLFHMDVMDGHFVPNLGLNFDLLRQVRELTQVPLDVHLMVDTPDDYISMIQDIQIQYVSFHVEASRNSIRLCRAFRAAGAKVAVALNPATPVSMMQYLVPEIDYAVLMTVEPGFAGQRFIPEMYEKVRELRELLDSVRVGVPIEVDGNLDAETSARCLAHGASILVGGTSSIFRPQGDVYTNCISFRQQLVQVCRERKIAVSDTQANEEV